jgi:hypothetical protein
VAGIVSRPRAEGASRWAVVAMIGALVVVGGGRARAQVFSPGPLAKPHGKLEGLDKCARCHEARKSLSAETCLACHTELTPRIEERAGFHGRLAPEKRDACQACHPDHRGRDFPLVDWEGDRKSFEHGRTGWRLQGAHARVGCGECHRKALVAAPAILDLLRRGARHETYLGLPTRCASCHFDEHRGQLGTDCQSCHSQSAWKPEPGFDHQKTAYALRGKHIAVPCAKCHPSLEDEGTDRGAVPKPRASSYLQMKPIEHRTCASCHRDPHEGKLGPACANCHTERGWGVLSRSETVDPSFHAKTRYPLEGGHIGVACRSCHGPFPGQRARYKDLAFSRCSDCHQDAHVGQLAGGAGACEACHTIMSFSPPSFEAEQHAQTQFPLLGAHAAVACRACHPLDARMPARAPADMRKLLHAEKRPLTVSLAVLKRPERPDACAACHPDPHAGQFAAEMREDGCARCHGTESFHDVSFDHGRDSRFPLDGAHATTACGACHRVQALSPKGAPTVQYKGLALACNGCHADEHQGQFERIAARAPGTTPKARAASDCGFCHPTTSFKETIFTHADARFTGFPLRGKHAELGCQRCHDRVEVASGLTTTRFRGLPTDCHGCHVDFHKGHFGGLAP